MSVPAAHASEGLKAILHSGLIPGAIVSIALNFILPKGMNEDA